MTVLAILEVTLLLAFIAICVSRPRFPLVTPAPPTRPAPPAAVPVPDPDRLEAMLRLRRLDHRAITEPTPTTVRIAPVHDKGAALQVLWVGNTMLADLEPADILTVRAWSRHNLVCSIGDVRPAYGNWEPALRLVAGWEIYVVTRAGRMLHLQGRPDANIDQDIVRFNTRMKQTQVADAA